MDIEVDAGTLIHEGVLRKSGRYPWGSGENAHQRNKLFLDHVTDLKRKGLSDTDIVKALKLDSTTELRAARSIANNEQKAARISQAQRFQEKGMSNVAIGERMGLNESSVRALLNPSTKEKNDILQTTANLLKDQVAEKKYLDVGAGSNQHVGVSDTQMRIAVAMLREEGYTYHYVNVPQVTTGHETKLKVLAAPDTPYKEVYANRDSIKSVSGSYTDDGGKTRHTIEPPTNVDSKRVQVRYKEDGGEKMDGVIELRRGVDDISLGSARYAQVRIAVDGTHYLKGMAMYADDLPDGVDMRFNTNKAKAKIGDNKLAAMKEQKDDPDDPNPFGAVVHQKKYLDKNGKEQLSPLNIVNEEGDWLKWSDNLSSQVLSKQSAPLAKRQLDLAFKATQDEYDSIMALTNPAVRKKLLSDFAESADSSSVHLKAAGLPRQSTNVILPITTMKETEIYAPKYNNGEKVALVRYPHGGVFEIPELTVNNRQPDANRLIKNARDAVGIHPNVASRLSGADFDGDTVLVIPNNKTGPLAIKNKPTFPGLVGFDPQIEYPKYDGMKVISPRAKQLKMGDVSNLITDMTIKGANDSEIERAVKHSMVVIDSEKHKLNWKQSAIDNGISDLKRKYQGGPTKGAATLISRASSSVRVNEREARKANKDDRANSGPIDPLTGEKRYTETGATYTKTTTTKTGLTRTVVKPKTTESTAMLEVRDARQLISDDGTPMEAIYADHANKLKALGNQARKSFLETPNLEYNPSANKAYAPQVQSLKAKLNVALKNAPLERQAQVVANTIVKAKTQSNPDMDKADLKKVKGRALTEARYRVGAGKTQVKITDEEWTAIQSGAVSNNFLKSILANSDIDVVKKLAMPKDAKPVTTNQVARAKAMAAAGYTQSEISEQLGLSTGQLNGVLYPVEGG